MPTEKWIIAPDRLWALGIFIMWHQNSISKMHRYRSILVTWETLFWPITLYHSDCWCVMCSFSWKSVLQALRVIRATDFPLVAVDVHRLAADEAAPTASSWRDVCVDIQMHVVCLLPPSPTVEWQLPLHSAVGTSLILLVLTSVCMLGVFKIVLPRCWSKIKRCLVHGSACGNWGAPEQQLLCFFIS